MIIRQIPVDLLSYHNAYIYLVWKKVLTDAVASGEIGPQQDLDTVAATFQSLFYGYAFHAAVGKSFDPAALQAQMTGFYQALRK